MKRQISRRVVDHMLIIFGVMSAVKSKSATPKIAMNIPNFVKIIRLSKNRYKFFKHCRWDRDVRCSNFRASQFAHASHLRQFLPLVNRVEGIIFNRNQRSSGDHGSYRIADVEQPCPVGCLWIHQERDDLVWFLPLDDPGISVCLIYAHVSHSGNLQRARRGSK